METFSIGDVVQLKSGGLPMTIACVFGKESETEVSCLWCEAYGKGERVAERTFDVRVLKKVKSGRSWFAGKQEA